MVEENVENKGNVKSVKGLPLFLRTRLLVLLLGNHAEPSPKIITLFTPFRNEGILGVASHDRLGNGKLDFCLWRASECREDGCHRRLKRVRCTRNG